MMPIDTFMSTLSTLLYQTQVWAYLDPGSGSMMLQIMLASVLSSVFFMKSWFRHIRDELLIRNKKA
jgi:hypothetical protein